MTEIIERKPWQRREDESAKAFHAFILYRDMLPKERSIEKVRENLNKNSGYYRHLANWSSSYQWVVRATAHDEHLVDIRSEGQEHAIREMAERQAKEGMALQALGLKRFMDKEGNVIVNISKDRDAIKAIEVGSKLERAARGEPTEIIKGEITHKIKPIEQWSNEELDKYLAEGEMPE